VIRKRKLLSGALFDIIIFMPLFKLLHAFATLIQDTENLLNLDWIISM